MLEEEYPLPGAELEPSIDNRHHFARASEGHANVRGAVVGSFILVLVISGLGNKTLKEFLQVAARGRRCVFHEDKTATGVANKHRCRSCPNLALADDLLHLVGDFVGSFSLGPDLESFIVETHRGTLARGPPRNEGQVLTSQQR